MGTLRLTTEKGNKQAREHGVGEEVVRETYGIFVSVDVIVWRQLCHALLKKQ